MRVKNGKNEFILSNKEDLINFLKREYFNAQKNMGGMTDEGFSGWADRILHDLKAQSELRKGKWKKWPPFNPKKYQRVA